MKGERWIDYHHRVPKSRGGSNSVRNLVPIRKDRHVAFHLLVGNALPDEVARIISELIDPDYKLVAVRRTVE